MSGSKRPRRRGDGGRESAPGKAAGVGGGLPGGGSRLSPQVAEDVLLVFGGGGDKHDSEASLTASQLWPDETLTEGMADMVALSSAGNICSRKADVRAMLMVSLGVCHASVCRAAMLPGAAFSSG